MNYNGGERTAARESLGENTSSSENLFIISSDFNSIGLSGVIIRARLSVDV